MSLEAAADPLASLKRPLLLTLVGPQSGIWSGLEERRCI